MKRRLFAPVLAIFALSASAYDISDLKTLPDHPEKGKWVQCIKVDAPQTFADLTTATPLSFQAKGMSRIMVRCGKHILTPEGVNLDSEGRGSFAGRVTWNETINDCKNSAVSDGGALGQYIYDWKNCIGSVFSIVYHCAQISDCQRCAVDCSLSSEKAAG